MSGGAFDRLAQGTSILPLRMDDLPLQVAVGRPFLRRSTRIWRPAENLPWPSIIWHKSFDVRKYFRKEWKYIRKFPKLFMERWESMYWTTYHVKIFFHVSVDLHFYIFPIVPEIFPPFSLSGYVENLSDIRLAYKFRCHNKFTCFLSFGVFLFFLLKLP